MAKRKKQSQVQVKESPSDVADRAWSNAKTQAWPAIGNADGPHDDDGGPWHENAVGELEDFDDGTETA